MSVRGKRSRRKLPHIDNPETLRPEHVGSGALLTVRSALIFGSSIAIAIAAGALTYLSGQRHAGGIPSTAIVAGIAAFMAAVKLLDAIIDG
jgi:hypothetical protein